jgi:hypothetical protein
MTVLARASSNLPNQCQSGRYKEEKNLLPLQGNESGVLGRPTRIETSVKKSIIFTKFKANEMQLMLLSFNSEFLIFPTPISEHQNQNILVQMLLVSRSVKLRLTLRGGHRCESN